MASKRIILTCILLSGFCSLKAAPATKEDSIHVFYEILHKAEFKFLINKYQDASDLYDSAFGYNLHPLATDIHNQLICFLEAKNYPRALGNCNRLVLKGAKLTYFRQRCFNAFNQSEEAKALTRGYAINHERFLNAINNEALTALTKLIDADQSVHCMLPTKSRDTAFVNRMHKNDDSLAIIVNDLMLNNDFLSEEVIGAAFEDDTTLSENPRFSIVIIHQIQKSGDLLTMTVERAIRTGKLRPEKGLEWIGSRLRFPINLVSHYIVFGDTLRKSYSAYPNRRLSLKLQGNDEDDQKYYLHYFYLDDAYYDLERRIVYNYYKDCTACISPVNKGFYILPHAMFMGDCHQSSADGVQKNAYDHFYSFAFPNYKTLSDR